MSLVVVTTLSKNLGKTIDRGLSPRIMVGVMLVILLTANEDAVSFTVLINTHLLLVSSEMSPPECSRWSCCMAQDTVQPQLQSQ